MQQTYAAAASPPIFVQSAKPGMPEHSLKTMLCSRGKSTVMCFSRRCSSQLAHCSRDACGWNKAVLAADLTAAARCWSKQKPRQPLCSFFLLFKTFFKFNFLISSHLSEGKKSPPFPPFSIAGKPGCKSAVKPSAAEPDVLVSSSTGLIPPDISHSSTGSSTTVSLCLGMCSGLPHSLYAACWKGASARRPALPWLSAPPHRTHTFSSPGPSRLHHLHTKAFPHNSAAQRPPRGTPRDPRNPSSSDKTFEDLIHRCDKQPASLWMKPADKA